VARDPAGRPVSLSSALRLLRAPELSRSEPQRLRTYLLVNALAAWFTAVVLVVLRVTLVDTVTITVDAAIVIGAGLLILLAQVLAQRGHGSAAAALVVVTNWFTALALTWTAPFLAPIGLLALLVPLVVVAEHLHRGARTVIGLLTVPMAGAVAFLGELRRPDYAAENPTGPFNAVVVGAFVCVVGGVVLLGLRDYARRLEQRTQELEVSRARLAHAALEARRAIERDLHDGAQQRLAGLAVDLGRANRLCDTEPERAREIVHGLQDQLEDAIRELRDLAHGIYPPLLGERGLAGALPAAARRTSLPCVVEVRGVGRYAPAVEAATYFCCLEAMQNADRHSRGSLITVRATDGHGTLRFSVSDDGTGFDALGAEAAGAHGLDGMRDRVRAAGGELVLTSAPGEGTVIEGTFPSPLPRAT
jgi:signal transduction histidine kinase